MSTSKMNFKYLPQTSTENISFKFIILMIRKVTGKPVEMTMRTMCAWAGLHTNDRLLLEAVFDS